MILYKGEQGVFISIPTMDIISLKLIDRESLIKEKMTLGEMYSVLKSEKKVLKGIIDKKEDIILSKNDIIKTSNSQISILLNTIELQKKQIKQEKRKAFKNKLVLFGVGLGVGAGIFAVIM